MNLKKTKHLLEAIGLRLIFGFFKALPLDLASSAGGFIAQSIGPFLRAQETADRNLRVIYPKMNAKERMNLLLRMWDNLGRNAAELPHLPGEELVSRVTIHGLEHLPKDRQVLMFGGHYGNWELTYPLMHRRGMPITIIYREANNPYVDRMIATIRGTQSAGMVPKGTKGAIKLVRAIKSGHSFAMLVDQKMNDGIPVPFFGHDAMTAPAIAELSLRYDMPIIPARLVRMKGCHFECMIEPAIAYEKTGDQEKDVFAIMKEINLILERWIREKPEQWFWVHKRWPG